MNQSNSSLTYETDSDRGCIGNLLFRNHTKKKSRNLNQNYHSNTVDEDTDDSKEEKDVLKYGIFGKFRSMSFIKAKKKSRNSAKDESIRTTFSSCSLPFKERRFHDIASCRGEHCIRPFRVYDFGSTRPTDGILNTSKSVLSSKVIREDTTAPQEVSRARKFNDAHKTYQEMRQNEIEEKKIEMVHKQLRKVFDTRRRRESFTKKMIAKRSAQYSNGGDCDKSRNDDDPFSSFMKRHEENFTSSNTFLSFYN